MEMQVVVVTHNVLPMRSLRWQNIPSSLPVKCKVYSCGRVRQKRGQQNSSKCLDKGLFYPYIPHISSPCPPYPNFSLLSFRYLASIRAPLNSISPAQLRFTSQKAITEVCAKEGRSLMKQVWSTGVKAASCMHIENASLKSLLCCCAEYLPTVLSKWEANFFLEFDGAVETLC